MKRKIVLGIMLFGIIALLSGIAFARVIYKYDPQTGNTYSGWQNGGHTHIHGHNNRTGSSWDTDISPNGSMHGRDSNNNYWHYNNQTGIYNNLGTGEIRRYDPRTGRRLQ